MFVNNKISSLPMFLAEREMMGSAEQVGAKVKELRERQSLSVAELARRAKMHRSHIQRIEDGTFGYPRPQTIAKLAMALNCDVDELTGRLPLRQVTPYESNPTYRRLIDMLEAVLETDRAEVIRHALWTLGRIRTERPQSEPVIMDNILPFPSGANEDGDFPPPPVAPEEFIEKDTDAPRPLHAWIRPVDAEGAAGAPRQSDDWLIPTTQLLNSLQEVRDDRVKVVKIFGSSMHPILRNGWKVLLDPAKSLFKPGKIVMVYIRDEGTTIGLLAEESQQFKIVKRNAEYGGPMEIPLRAGEWYPVGTVTTIVEAPVEIE